MTDLDDNTALITVYKNNVDGRPVIGFNHSYHRLSDVDKSMYLNFAKGALYEELLYLTGGNDD